MGSQTAAAPLKSRRKISLPWFRQSSVSAPHAALSRQHTIDSPGSFHARLLRNTRQRHQAGGEMTWVVGEHTASGSGELTVSKGQQVEVVEACAGRPEWWVVRLPGEPPQEGAVPAAVLKPHPAHPAHPAPNTSPSRTPATQHIDTEPPEAAAAESAGTGAAAASTASPGNKTKRFSSRWKIPHLRKSSSGKAEKASGAQSPGAASEKPPPLKKIPSEKKIRFVSGEGRSGSAADEVLERAAAAAAAGASSAIDEAEDDLPDVELPPPMKPIQDPQAVLQQVPSASDATAEPSRASALSMDALENNGSADIAEIEQIVKEKMEQHGAGAGAIRSSEPGEDEPATPSGDPVVDAVKKREYVLRELIDTEEIYVSDLQLVVDGYLRHVREAVHEPLPPDVLRNGRERFIFSNIEAIYDWHRNHFSLDLRPCLESPELLGPLFRRLLDKRVFMYEAYCRNKPVSEFIVSEHDAYFQELRQKLGHKLQLADLLIKPVQRIQKYHLLVQKVLLYSEEANVSPQVLAALRDAVLCTSVIPKTANDMMNVGRLQGYSGNITAQGKLLHQEELICFDITNGPNNDRGKELYVFIFEQSVIFSEAIGKKTQFTNPAYDYKFHIQMNMMELEEVPPTADTGTAAFIIRSTNPKKPKVAFLCRAAEPKIEVVLMTLNKVLRSQHALREAMENPIAYQRELGAAREPREGAPGSAEESMWAGQRRTEPPPELRGRQQRAHVKANTINLPTTTIKADDRDKLSLNVSANNASLSPTSPPHSNGLSKKPWALRLRRAGSSAISETGAEGSVTELHAPELLEGLSDTSVAPGAAATFSCRVRGAHRAALSWRKTAPETRALRAGGRFTASLSADNVATLTVNVCRASDAGVYCCLVSNELGGVQTSARLTVGAAGSLAPPLARQHPAGGLSVQWENATPTHLEYCRVGEGEWRRAGEQPAARVGTLTLDELAPGSYSFRSVCAASGVASAASAPACALGSGAGWQREQFLRRYAVEEEVGRGRTARVVAARDTGTGQRVALKQVVSGRGADAAREYRMLSSCAHSGVVRALALFPEVPALGVHTLVLELVSGGPLLEWAVSEPQAHTEARVATHAHQLLSALHYLHNQNISHLDVKPENVMMEVVGGQAQVKLVDLGSALEGEAGAAGGAEGGGEVLPPAPAQLEFAPPECVLGRPPSPAWDAWSAGVLLYVFLSGLSPFLDDSVEETTANIIKCDYCFPPEHWASIDVRAQAIIRGLLDPNVASRMTPGQAITNSWFSEASTNVLSANQLKTFLERRRPAGHGNVLSHSLRSPDT